MSIGKGEVGAVRPNSAAGLGVNDTTPIDVTAGQQVTATDSFAQNRTINAQIVGPVLGVNDGASSLTYGDDINLREVDVGATVVKELVVSNLFTQEFGQETSLTIFNVGIAGDTLGFYCILTSEFGDCVGSADATPLDDSIVLADGRRLSNDGVNPSGAVLPSLWIQFNPLALLTSGYAPTLEFYTDMNSNFNVMAAAPITIDLVGSTSGGAVPQPATVLLLGAGLFGLARYRGRQRRGTAAIH